MTRPMNDHRDAVELLRDALDHIARIAGSARVPTRRLDWIASRARMALRGKTWDRDYLPEPRRQTDERVKDLHADIRVIVRAYLTKDEIALAKAIAKVQSGYPSLFRDMPS